MNALHVERAFSSETGEDARDSSNDEIWVTNVDLDGNKYAVMMAATLKNDRSIFPESDLGMERFAAFEANSTKNIVTKGSIELKKCGKWDFQHWAFAPILPNGFALIGEQSKWIPVSAARFSQLSWSGSEGEGKSISVVATGPVNENVTVSFYDASNEEIIIVTCQLKVSYAR